MCILCIEIEKERLLPKEALRNYIEISESLEDHAPEALQVLYNYLEERNFCIWCSDTTCTCAHNNEWSVI